MRWTIEKSAGDNHSFIAVSIDDGRKGMSYNEATKWAKLATDAVLAITSQEHRGSTHTTQEDFEHFLSYSGLRGEAPEVIEKMRLAFEAAA